MVLFIDAQTMESLAWGDETLYGIFLGKRTSKRVLVHDLLVIIFFVLTICLHSMELLEHGKMVTIGTRGRKDERSW